MVDDVFTEKLSAPLVVFWELTQQCNLSCCHCYTHSDMGGARTERKVHVHILRELCTQPIFTLGLGGGEPLMVPWLDEIVSQATGHGIDVNLSTNGIALTHARAKRLAARGVSLIQVSIDGRERTHDLIRGTGTHAKALRAIRAVADAGVVCRVGFTVHRMNMDEMEDVFDEAVAAGAQWFIVFRYMSSGRAGDSIALNAEDLQDISSRLVRLQQQHPTQVFFERLLFLPFLYDERYVSHKHCNAGTSILNVRANGDVTPCPHMQGPVVGNLLQEDVQTLWHSPRMHARPRHRAFVYPARTCPVAEEGVSVFFRSRGPRIRFVGMDDEPTLPHSIAVRPFCFMRYCTVHEVVRSRYRIHRALLRVRARRAADRSRSRLPRRLATAFAT